MYYFALETHIYIFMIGLFNDCFPPIMDGVSVTVCNYAQWLSHRRNDVCVVTPQMPESHDEYDFPVHRYMSFPIPVRKPYRLGVPQIDFSFQRIINGIDFSLLHAHCPFSSGEIALSIAKNRHIPLVATFHSKYRADFERLVPNKYIVDYMIRNIVNFYNQADEVWIPQAAVEETLREYGYKGKVEVVENGNDYADKPYSIELKQKAKQQLGIKKHTPLLLFVGQHIWEKNVEMIIKALSKIRDEKFKMVFVGTGYAAEDMKKMARKVGLKEPKERIRFDETILDRELLRQYYLAADLFLFPSLYDNAPLVVREAAAMHTPTLFLKGSTAAEIISDGVNGFLSDNSTKAYSKYIKYLLHHPNVINSVGDNASKTLARSWKDIAEEVNDRYNHLIYRLNKKII